MFGLSLFKDRLILTYLAAVAALLLAMGLYRGGNFSNSTLQFQWATGFVSDLGRVSTNAATQPWVRIFYTLFSFLIALTISYLGERISWLISTAKNKSALIITSSALSVTTLAIALIPSDVNSNLHRLALLLTVLIGIIFLALIIRLIRFSATWITWLIIGTSLALGAYLLFIIFGPRPEVSIMASNVHAQLEKSVVLLFLVSIGGLIIHSPSLLPKLPSN